MCEVSLLVTSAARIYILIHLDMVGLQKNKKHTRTNMLSLPDNLKTTAVKTKKKHETHLAY